jgi:hypothetical protein
MSRLARWIAPAALAGGLVAGLVAIPAAQASSAASITINATSPNFPGLKAKDHGKVDGFALVIYKATTGNVNTATISGTVTTTVATDTATLQAEPFGAKSYKPVGSPLSLTSVGVNDYAFNVTPSLATKYEVVVTGTDSGTSSPVTVYVTLANIVTSSKVQPCSPARCVDIVKVSTTLPASAYKVESRKHFYLYLAIGHFRGTKAILPKDFTLSKASKASKPTRKTSSRFVVTLKYIVPHPHANTVWEFTFCTKDAVSKDGIGLPGHHGCGSKQFARKTLYVG